MIRRPPRSTLFPTRRSSDLVEVEVDDVALADGGDGAADVGLGGDVADRKSTRLNSSHVEISYAVFCLKKKNETVRTIAQHMITRWRSANMHGYTAFPHEYYG